MQSRLISRKPVSGKKLTFSPMGSKPTGKKPVTVADEPDADDKTKPSASKVKKVPKKVKVNPFAKRAADAAVK